MRHRSSLRESPRRLAHVLSLLALLALVASASCGDRVSNVITPASTACTTNAACPAVRPVCDETAMTCRGCTSNDECRSTGRPFCDGAAGQCVECLRNVDCSGAFRTICDTSAHRCVECLIDAHCPLTGDICNPVARSCTIACDADKDCFIAFPFCDAGVQLCVECRKDSECADLGLPYCRSLTCTF